MFRKYSVVIMNLGNERKVSLYKTIDISSINKDCVVAVKCYKVLKTVNVEKFSK